MGSFMIIHTKTLIQNVQQIQLEVLELLKKMLLFSARQCCFEWAEWVI